MIIYIPNHILHIFGDNIKVTAICFKGGVFYDLHFHRNNFTYNTYNLLFNVKK